MIVRNYSLRIACAFTVFALLVLPGISYGDGLVTLKSGFLNPPAEARPGVMWHWMNGFVSEEGIRRDLIDLHEKGIQKVELFNANMFPWQGPVRYGSDRWHDCIRFAIRVADSLGMEFIPMMGDGWATAGGPWNRPEHAMKQIVWSETEVQGGGCVQIELSRPKTELNYYRDVAVVAVPAEEPEENKPVRVSSSMPEIRTEWLTDGDPKTVVGFDNPRIKGRPEYIEFDFGRPFTASMLLMDYGNNARRGYEGTVQVSDDGVNFRTVRTFDYYGQVWAKPTIAVNFPEETARYFRVVFRGGDLVRYVYRIAGMTFSNRYRIDNYHSKSARAMIEPDIPRRPVGEGDPRAIPSDRVIDLSDRMSPEGTLEWEVPAGNWTVLRFGYTAINRVNHPATKEGTGLECDKMDPGALKIHFDHTMGRIIRESKAGGYRSLCGVLLDSNESGPQSWTARFPEEFRRRKGYDMVRFLPTLTGRVVESEAVTECFLWDYRRVISDLVTDYFYGTLGELIRGHGLKFYNEPYGAYFDHYRAARHADGVTCEFWNGYITNNSKFIASVVHTTGRNVVAAEAYTAQPAFGSYANTPCSLKFWGDKTLAEGVNLNILHSYVHQPFDSLRPGFTLSRYGTHFNPGNTWWRYADGWIDYLASCQFLLQQGRFVGDICYLNPSDLAEYYRYRYPECPEGYDFDICNDQTLMNMEVDNEGLLTLGGMRYRVLVIQDWHVMPLTVLRKIHRLVTQGATVVGVRPAYSPSLMEYRTRMDEFDRLASDLWNGDPVCRLGRGEMWNGELTGAMLASMGIEPDFICRSRDSVNVDYIHRTTPEAEIYFIANQSQRPVAVTVKLRDGAGAAPQIWDPVRRDIRTTPVFAENEEGTILPLSMATHASLFVVLPKGERKTGIERVVLDGQTIFSAEEIPPVVADGECPVVWSGKDGQMLLSRRGRYEFVRSDRAVRVTKVNRLPRPIVLTGDWQVTFPLLRRPSMTVSWGKLYSWSEHSDPEIRYFSGTATYRKTFDFVGTVDGLRYWLEWNKVKDIAEIRINGKSVGTVWAPPYRMDITEYLMSGENRIEIAVTNTWVNRLIGDEQLPADLRYKPQTDGTAQLLELPDWMEHPSQRKSDRRTFCTWKHWSSDSPLHESGLIGEVRIIPAAVARF